MILFVAAGLWLLALVVVHLFVHPADRRREIEIDLAAIGGIGAGTLGFFWRLLFTSDTWMPAGGGDLAGFLYPTYHFAAQWWRQGVIPLWNPYLFGGAPFVGDIQSSIFYPLNLLTFLLSNPLSYRDMELLAVLHFFIAGAGMYALLRWGPISTGRAAAAGPGGAGAEVARGLSRPACLAGALAFEYSDLFITHFGNLNLIATAAWLPLIFLLFSRAVDDRRPGLAALGGVVLAIAFLAGSPQPFLFILIALALYALVRAAERRALAVQVLVLLAVTLLVGFGLSALTLLPSVELARASVRSTFSYEQAAQYSLPPAQLIGMLVPGFFGRGAQAAWGPWPRVEVGYIGVLPLLLAGLALVLRWNHRTRFFAFLALVGLLLALGGYAILNGWLYAFLPGLSQLRAPARFVFVMDFALAVLAAVGFDALLGPLTEAQQRALRGVARFAPRVFLVVALVGGGGALAILILGQGQDPVLFDRIANAANSVFFFLLLLAFSIGLIVARGRNLAGAPAWATLALGLIFLDLFSLGAYVDIGLSDPTAAYNRQDIVEFLQSQSGLFRIDSRTDAEGTWLADTAVLYGLSDVNGDNPLVVSDFDRYWESLGGRAARAYDLLNIRFVLARRATPLDKKFRRVFDGASGISVYENLDALPRAWVVYSSRTAGDHAAALQATQASGFDPGAAVVLEGAGARDLSASLAPDDAQITGYGPNEIDLNVTAKQEGYLVLSEVYYPGWRAVVDDRGTGVLNADYLFRAVALTPGTHTVRLVYDPLSFKLGAALSGLTIAGLIGGAVYAVRRRQKSKRLAAG